MLPKSLKLYVSVISNRKSTPEGAKVIGSQNHVKKRSFTYVQDDNLANNIKIGSTAILLLKF